MARRCGLMARSLFSTARTSALRSPPPLPRLRPPTASTRRCFSPTPPRSFGEIGCTLSFLPLYTMALPRVTSHLTVEARACCELYGTFRCTCQDPS